MWRRQGSNLGRRSRQIYSLLPLAARAHRRGCCPSHRFSTALRGNDVNDTRCVGVLRHPIDRRPEGRGWLGLYGCGPAPTPGSAAVPTHADTQ